MSLLIDPLLGDLPKSYQEVVSERIFSQFYIVRIGVCLWLGSEWFNAHNSDLERTLVCSNSSET